MDSSSSEPESSSKRPVPWYAVAVTDVLSRLGASGAGLSEPEAAQRLARHGRNEFRPPRPASALRILVDQLTSVVVFLLLAAGAASLLMGDRLEAAAVGVVLLLNTSIGFFTEIRARRAMEALLQYQAPHAKVLREGIARVVAANILVPGDVVELSPGSAVPADVRIIESTDLRTIEAALTGESLPVSKTVDPLPEGTPLADRRNMAYKGTMVAAGVGRAVVTETGADTELGRIGVLVGGIREERTPLERRLDILGRRLVWLAIGVAALVAALGFLHGAPLGLVIELGIALAVAAVPEALPAVATIALAVGLSRMARRHALVRRLPAVEALGSTTVVCTDKTRTLTSGEMTVVKLWSDGGLLEPPQEGTPTELGRAVRRALETASLASRPQAEGPGAPAEAGDPVDKAMLRAAQCAGIDRGRLESARPPAGLVPFSSGRKLMASFHREDGAIVAHVKGAPGRIVSLCDRLALGSEEPALDQQGRTELLAANEDMARRGLRVLALASGPVVEPAEAALAGLTFLGFVGLMDPPAAGVKATIATLRAAGLRTLMLTGDQRVTAEAVGRELGVISSTEQVLDGRALDELSDPELAERIGSAGAFSRVTPEHKLRIVKALQARGDIVAMIGDGVNDAAALRKADVGVAMGRRGTDVAKEAASIVLQDDRFETIAVAAEQGRVIYDNIRKFVFYLFSCNVAEVLVLLVAGLVGLPTPLLPLQVLWLNLVTDTFPALALAMEPGDPHVMSRPPRDPQEAILSRRFAGSVAFYALLITASTFAAFLWALHADPARATTLAFTTLALAQVFHLGNARSAEPVLEPSRAFANPYAVGAVALSVVLQVSAVELPFLARVLRVVPLGVFDWALVLTLAAVPALLGQTLRWVRSRRIAAVP